MRFVIDMKVKMQFEMYKKTSSEDSSIDTWCWRLRDDNNKTLAYSANHFPSKELCEANIRVLVSLDDSVSIISMPEREPNMMSAFLEKLFAQKNKEKT
jgi:hypothetical protein